MDFEDHDPSVPVQKSYGYFKNEVPDSIQINESVQPMFASPKK